MNISTLSTRFTGFARNALSAAKGKPNRQSKIGNRQSSSPPLALASIIRPQVRERWLLPQVGAITPQYIEMTLRGALAGAHIPQWELFNLMEDTWPRLRKNVLELKMAVRNRRAVFEAYREEDEQESATATERMKLVSAALRHMQPDPAVDEGAFDDMVTDILDAWFKGVSVLEIDWHVAQTRSLGRFIAPRCTRWASPVSYAWDGDLRLGLADDTQQTLTPFPSDRVLIAKCKTKSGSILGGALLRPLVWWWCAANFSADWLLNFAQLFGLPFRWATYEATAAQETVDRICAMLQNMGSAGWAAFPAGTALELKAEGQKSGSDTPQGDMLDRADKQCDLLVLGQTLTTDTGGMGSGGGSHALGKVHADVRSNIVEAAAKFAAGVIEQQLIPTILRLNYGDTDEAPTLTFQERTEDDLGARAQWIATLAGAGAGGIIPLDWLGKTFGIPKPETGEATLAEPVKPAPTQRPNEPFEATNNWNPLLHLRDALGRFAYIGGGSQGSPGSTESIDLSKAHVDPQVKDKSLDEAKRYYQYNIEQRYKIYKTNKEFLNSNLFTTAVDGPQTVPIDERGGPKKNGKVNPEALKLWKQIFLDDGTTGPEEPEHNLGECVSLVSNLTGITPKTNKWKGGSKVIDAVDKIKPGTAIASFCEDGKFHAEKGGHAAIFLCKGKNPETGNDCIVVVDQFNPGHGGHHPDFRYLDILPEPAASTPDNQSNKANFFRVIEIK